MFLFHAARAGEPGQPATVFNVTAFGAKGDGLAMDTVSIQAAIDAASRAGGGVVELPAGKYLSGSLRLKSHVEFRVDPGAVLLGSTSRADYQRIRWYALLLASKQTDIKVDGGGTIDGQGLALAMDVKRRADAGEFGPQTRHDRPDESDRPMVIEFSDCREVTVSGVTLRNSSGWLENYIRCENVVIEGIKVDNTAYWNNDGMDITDCRDVRISKCDINSDDDGICLKSDRGGGKNGMGDESTNVKNSPGCYNVDISDCRIRSSASALKFGTASFGGFHKIHATNLTVYDTFRSAIALECVDGGVLEDVLVENVVATNTGGAIFIRLGRRNTNAPAGQLQNVTIRNIKVQVPAGKPDAGYQTAGPVVRQPHNIFPSSIVGLPGSVVRNVRLENIEITEPGGGDPKLACVPAGKLDAVPERPEKYPEFSMFGELPAWGFYVRHVEGIQLVNVRLVRLAPDYRPALVLDDVHQLEVTGLAVEPAADGPELVLQNVRGATFDQGGAPPLSRQMVLFNKNCADIAGLQ